MSSRRRGGRALDLGVILLAHELFSSGITPPVTLVSILAQAAIYLGFVPFLDFDKIRKFVSCYLTSYFSVIFFLIL